MTVLPARRSASSFAATAGFLAVGALVSVDAAGAAGAATTPTVGTVRQQVAYGSDDRIEWSALPESALKQSIRGASVALMPGSALQFDGASVELSAAPLGATQNLCAGERFAFEPAAALCSGVLIDDDLVATAAHCLATVDGCQGRRFVFDYALRDAASAVRMGSDAVYDCRRRVPLGTDAGPSEMAILQLDRSAVAGGGQPFELAPRDPRDGEAIVHASYGQGIPLKVDPDAHVALGPASGSSAFTVAVDAFGGASGSGVLLEDGTLAGILQSGRQDYVMRGDCRVARTVDEKDGAERVTLVRTAVAELCASGWPSVRLCGRGARCGDGVCSPGESSVNCPSDCAASECGDGLCELAERGACDRDCGPGRPGGVPFEWFCAPAWYGSGERCDCACGAPDPDCANRACAAYGPLGASRLPAGSSLANEGTSPGDGGDGSRRDGGAGSPLSKAPRDHDASLSGTRAASTARGGCSVARTAVNRPGPERISTLLGLLGLSALRGRRRTPALRGRRRTRPRVLLGALVLLGCSRQGPAVAPTNAAPSGTVAPLSSSAAAPTPATPGGSRTAAPCSGDFTAAAARAMRGMVSLVVTRSPSPDTANAAESRRAASPVLVDTSNDGSAVLVSKNGAGDGIVVTSAHVVRDTLRIDAVGPNGRLFRTAVLATDEPSDLAVLRIKGDLGALEPMAWSVDAPRPGGPVLVVGNALGRGLTASAGILSATARTGLGHTQYEDFVVTDARMPRGTSGGALVDATGKLLGINTGILVDAGVAFGIAVSARLAVPVLRDLAEGRSVSRGHVGVEVEDLDPARAEALGYGGTDGALVSKVEPGSPAARSGLAVHDIVIAANGWAVARRGNFRAALSTVPGGTTVPLVIVRAGQELRLTLTPSSRGPNTAHTRRDPSEG